MKTKIRSTIRQKRLARLIVDNLKGKEIMNGGEMLEKVGYTEKMSRFPSKIIEGKGVQAELKILGFDEDSAKKVVAEIMLNEDVEPNARLKATEQVFKVHGSYAPEKHLIGKVDFNQYEQLSNEQLKQLAEERELDTTTDTSKSGDSKKDISQEKIP